FLLAFIFTQILRASLGSSTVALVTTSSILGPQVAALGVSPVLLGLAICSGAIGLSLPNDSGFWVVNKFGKLTITQTLKARSEERRVGKECRYQMATDQREEKV